MELIFEFVGPINDALFVDDAVNLIVVKLRRLSELASWFSLLSWYKQGADAGDPEFLPVLVELVGYFHSPPIFYGVG